jgi:hypothetical protein
VQKGLVMSLPASRDPSHDDGKWATIRYALDSNARTLRLCLIWAVVIVSPALVTVITLLLRHVLLADLSTQPPSASGVIPSGG